MGKARKGKKKMNNEDDYGWLRYPSSHVAVERARDLCRRYRDETWEQLLQRWLAAEGDTCERRRQNSVFGR